MSMENLFSVSATDLAQARNLIESCMATKLIPHESEYHGGEYFRGHDADVKLLLQENFVEDDGEPTETSFPLARLLLYVDGAENDVKNIGSILLSSGCAEKLLRSNIF